MVRRLMHRLRTEGEGPYRETFAIGLGVFIGCTPFYGLHLLICWLSASLFRLNRMKVYLAANLSNPLFAPFLLLAELQVGAFLRSGKVHPLTIETVRTVDPWQFGVDVLIGSLVVGGVLATAAAALTYAAVRGGSNDSLFERLARQASDRYVSQSMTAWEFARAKLRADPVYRDVLGGGFLPSGGTLLDVGCGQGLMLGLLIEAEDAVRGSTWPKERPLPPRFDRLVGVETRSRVARLADSALGPRAQILRADARSIELEDCSAVLLFDVLQMMSRDGQASLLGTIERALAPDGVILVREADAAAGLRFSLVRVFNRLKALFVGAWRQEFNYRNRDEWVACFRSFGWQVDLWPGRGGNRLGNQLFRVSRRLKGS